MLGFTGTYEGHPISVMGSGMGMPSIGIYSYELFKFYDVDNIIRIGSAGSYTDKAKLFDVVLATGAVSESNYARVQSGFEGDIALPSESLNEKLRASAAKQGIPLIEGSIHSSDVFYRQPSDAKPTYWEKLRDERGCLCVEMESYALFANAQVLGKNAACLLTISDSLVTGEALPEVDSFIDRAILNGQTVVYLIHGNGTGALRTAIHKHLRGNRMVKSFRLGRYGEGESGVTVVELK